MGAEYHSEMRFTQPVVMLLGTVMYVLVGAFFGQLETDDGGSWILVIVGVWNLALLVATAIAIVDGVLRIRAGKTRELAEDALLVKLASAPFFVITSVLLGLLFIGGLAIVLFGGVALWVAGTVGIVLTCLTMLSTSIPVWAAIARLRRERTIGTGLTILYAAMSLVFVTDIAAAVLVFGHSRRRPRLALLWVLIGTGAALIGIGLIGFYLGSVADGFNLGSLATSLHLEIAVGLVGWAPLGIIVLGGGVILATIIVSVVRRSTLRLEALNASTPTPPAETAVPRRRVGLVLRVVYVVLLAAALAIEVVGSVLILSDDGSSSAGSDLVAPVWMFAISAIALLGVSFLALVDLVRAGFRGLPLACLVGVVVAVAWPAGLGTVYLGSPF